MVYVMQLPQLPCLGVTVTPLQGVSSCLAVQSSVGVGHTSTRQPQSRRASCASQLQYFSLALPFVTIWGLVVKRLLSTCSLLNVHCYVWRINSRSRRSLNLQTRKLKNVSGTSSQGIGARMPWGNSTWDGKVLILKLVWKVSCHF